MCAVQRDPYLDDMLASFPYVNGGLFADENIEIPNFNEKIVNLLLDFAPIEVLACIASLREEDIGYRAILQSLVYLSQSPYGIRKSWFSFITLLNVSD